MAGTVASGIIRLRKSTLIPPNTIFVWLNTWSEDFEKVKQQLCYETSGSLQDWKFYDDKDNCSDFIRAAESKQHIVLISSGRLVADIIHNLHDLPQMHSIYIYCTKIDKYESLKHDLKKLHGVFNNPVELFIKLCENLDKEVRQSQWNISTVNNMVPIHNNANMKIHCLFKNEIKSYNNQNTPWSPWQTNSCTVPLPTKGQGTIEVWLHEPIPFEIHVSNRQNPNDNDTNSYAIVLKVDTREALLGTISAQHGHELRVRESTTEYHQVQLNENSWHCYWFTFYGTDLMAQYGIGEIRPMFKILAAQLPECDKVSIENISYLHIKIENKSDINAMEHVKDKLKIFISEEPVIFDPPLMIICPNTFSPIHPANNYGVLASLLENPYRYFYDQIINFTLVDENFPNFIETIQRSIENPNGWCYQKLKEKMNHFERRKVEATYLCIKMDELETGMLKYPCLIKIWPAGHYSPIHNYKGACGIMRVLHGKLFIKFFPGLSNKFHQSSSIEHLFEENQVTWMMPKLNQTCQMRNAYSHGSCCITIQCYQYEISDQEYCEHFDYISNDESQIKHYNSIHDDTYLDFKKRMKKESISGTSV